MNSSNVSDRFNFEFSTVASPHNINSAITIDPMQIRFVYTSKNSSRSQEYLIPLHVEKSNLKLINHSSQALQIGPLVYYCSRRRQLSIEHNTPLSVSNISVLLHSNIPVKFCTAILDKQHKITT